MARRPPGIDTPDAMAAADEPGEPAPAPVPAPAPAVAAAKECHDGPAPGRPMPRVRSDVQRCVERLAADALNDGLATAASDTKVNQSSEDLNSQWIFDDIIHQVDDLGTLDFSISDTLLSFPDTEYVQLQQRQQQQRHQQILDQNVLPSLSNATASARPLDGDAPTESPRREGANVFLATSNQKQAASGNVRTGDEPTPQPGATSAITASPTVKLDEKSAPQRAPKRPRTATEPSSNREPGQLDLQDTIASGYALPRIQPGQGPEGVPDTTKARSSATIEQIQPHAITVNMNVQSDHRVSEAKLFPQPPRLSPSAAPAETPLTNTLETFVKVGPNGLVPKLPAAKLQQHPVLGRLQLQPEDPLVNMADEKEPAVMASRNEDVAEDPRRKTSIEPVESPSVRRAKAETKKRLVWNSELHARFVAAVKSVGLHAAVPKTLVQLMNVDGLTTEHVKSHLQKYRSSLRKGFSDDEGHLSSGGASSAPRVPPVDRDATWTLKKTETQKASPQDVRPADARFAGHEMQKQIEKQIEMQDRTIQLQLQMQIMVHRTISLQRRLNMSLQRQSGSFGVASGGTSVSGDVEQNHGDHSRAESPLVHEHLVLLSEQKAMQSELEQQQALLKQQMDDQERVRQMLLRDAGLN